MTEKKKKDFIIGTPRANYGKSFLFLGLVQVVIECVTFSVKLKYSIEVYFLFELLLVREIQKLNG